MAHSQVNVRLRPADRAALANLRRLRGESISELIRRLLHEAHGRQLRERAEQFPSRNAPHAQKRQPGDL